MSCPLTTKQKTHLFPRPDVVHEDQTCPGPVSGSTPEERKSFQGWEPVCRAATENHPRGEIASTALERPPDGPRVEGGSETLTEHPAEIQARPTEQAAPLSLPWHMDGGALMNRSFWPPQLPPWKWGTCMPCSQIQQNSPGRSGSVCPLKAAGR